MVPRVDLVSRPFVDRRLFFVTISVVNCKGVIRLESDFDFTEIGLNGNVTGYL